MIDSSSDDYNRFADDVFSKFALEYSKTHRRVFGQNRVDFVLYLEVVFEILACLKNFVDLFSGAKLVQQVSIVNHGSVVYFVVVLIQKSIELIFQIEKLALDKFEIAPAQPQTVDEPGARPNNVGRVDVDLNKIQMLQKCQGRVESVRVLPLQSRVLLLIF